MRETVRMSVQVSVRVKVKVIIRVRVIGIVRVRVKVLDIIINNGHRKVSLLK
jgi:hypothetical protein